MKLLIILVALSVNAFSGEVMNKLWESSKNCYPCHKEIVKTWRTSRHAHSHFGKNDLFKKSLLYMTKKNPTMILDEMKMKCAQCHNPRIVKSTLDGDDKISLLMGHKSTQKAYRDMLGSTNMKDGINCLVCHNVDKIHLDKSKGSQGMNSIVFGPQGTMYGPFRDASTVYHQSVHKEHFDRDEPTLCFSCHYSGTNQHGLEVYSTGREYDKTLKKKGKEITGCKKCHMSRRKSGHASNYSKAGERPKKRMVRAHRFASVDNSDILEKYIDVSGRVAQSNLFTFLFIKITNHSPHKLPSGYGLRELTINVKFFDMHDVPLGSAKKVMGAVWGDAEGKPTIPHLASSLLKDTRIKGLSSKEYVFDIPKKAKYVTYVMTYRLVSETMSKEIGISDPFFKKEYTFFESRIPVE
ncbi:MAG: hypothetical protein DSY80_01190 [Desulfocapsa sp.]|nr:MAG: hypothetical protein DSY80_01190 [Desulfocapsa sp.]